MPESDLANNPLYMAAMLVGAGLACASASAANVVQPSEILSKPSYPEVSDSGYVLIEIWPEVRDITLTAYFLDDLNGRSRNLCEAVKRALDRDAKVFARQQNRTSSSYRLCMTIKDAVRLEYINPKS
jgi:hypothetical protein